MTKTWKESNTLLKLREAGADFKYRLTPEEKEAMNKPEPNAEEKYGERLWNAYVYTVTERIEDQIFYTLENSNGEWKEFLEGTIFNIGDAIEEMSYKAAQDYLIEDVGLEHGGIDGPGLANNYVYIGAFKQYGSDVFDAYKEIKKKGKFGLFFNLYEDPLRFDKDINVKGIKGLKSKANLLVKGLPGLDFSKEAYSEYKNTLVELSALASTSEDFYMDINIEEDRPDEYVAYTYFCIEFPLGDSRDASPNAKKALELIVNLLNCKSDMHR